MSCNVDLLHIGIWSFFSGCSLLLAATISFKNLDPVEKENLLKERNEVRQKVLKKATTQTLNSTSPLPARQRLRKMNFLV
jgi:hypothetical protein